QHVDDRARRSSTAAAACGQRSRAVGNADHRIILAPDPAAGGEADSDSAVPLLPRRHGAAVLCRPWTDDLDWRPVAAVGPATRHVSLPADRRHHRRDRAAFLPAPIVPAAAPGPERGATETMAGPDNLALRRPGPRLADRPRPVALLGGFPGPASLGVDHRDDRP